MDLEPPRSAERPAERFGHVCLRRLSVRAALVRRRAIRPVSAPPDRRVAALDTGGSFIVTYWPSEFSQVRAQYPAHQLRAPVASSANELLFQFQFSIGAHGAHPF